MRTTEISQQDRVFQLAWKAVLADEFRDGNEPSLPETVKVL
jgi:hypothetical protein